MRPVWLIEAGVYGAEAKPLMAEIRRQGMNAEFVPDATLRKGAEVMVGGQPLEVGACVLGYGTFPFARQIQLHRGWVPGAWCDPTNLDCTAYFAHFGKFLLNQRYVILPGVEAIRQRDWLYTILGRDEAVFVRPTGCHKLFTGRCIVRSDFATALSPTRYDPATLVVVASPQAIDREWRLVVAENRVIATSQYAVRGTKVVSPDCPAEVCAFTEEMLRQVRWQPDPIFMLDVCTAAGQLWLVEINGFSTSWLYECDQQAVVSKASELAEKAWARASRRDC